MRRRISEFDVTVWDQDVFRLSYGALDALLDALDASDAGVFVLRPDDLTTRRDESDLTVRDSAGWVAIARSCSRPATSRRACRATCSG